MEDSQIIEQLRKTNESIRVFSEIGKALTSTLDIKEVLRIVLQKISQLLKPSSWALLLTQDSNELAYELLINYPSVDRSKTIKLGQTLPGWVAEKGTPILWSYGKNASNMLPSVAVIPPEVLSTLCIPLRSKNRTLGVIELQKRTPDTVPFTQEDLSTLLIISDFAAIALENAQNFQKVQELTIIDDLTGLYNSRYLHMMLEQEVSRAARYTKEFALIFLDLDRFKQVNDKWGHMHGSALIRETGHVISTHIRTVDFAFRYGGDEFVIFMPETSKNVAFQIAERLRQTMQDHHFLTSEGMDIQFTASFGVACFPEDGSTKNELIKMADDAMYKVKHTTKNRVEMA